MTRREIINLMIDFINKWKNKVTDYSDTIILNNLYLDSGTNLTKGRLERIQELEKKWSLKYLNNENHLATK